MVRSEALEIESSPAFWDALAPDMGTARQSVWAGPVPAEEWQAGTDATVGHLLLWLPASPRRLLDVGCGIGRLTLPVARHFGAGTQVTGLDISRRMLGLAEAEAARQGIENVTWCTEADGVFDAAFCVAVLQHQPRDRAARLIADVSDRLVPGARAIFQVVTDTPFEDEGRVPADIARAWMREAGFEVRAIARGVIEPDWLWLIGEKVGNSIWGTP